MSPQAHKPVCAFPLRFNCVCVCAHGVVSQPECVQDCMRVCGCIDPFLAVAV